jgi:hypothetical protein
MVVADQRLGVDALGGAHPVYLFDRQHKGVLQRFIERLADSLDPHRLVADRAGRRGGGVRHRTVRSLLLATRERGRA